MSGIVPSLSHRILDAWQHLFGHAPAPAFEPIVSSGLRAVCHTAWPTDPRFARAWQDLYAASATATTFHTCDWQHAVAQTLVRRDRLRLIVVWEGSGLVAVLPLYLREPHALDSIAPGVTDHLDPLVCPDREADAWRIILKLLNNLSSDAVREVVLHNLPDGAACRAILPAVAASEGFAHETATHESCPAIPLPPTWDAYLASLDPHVRKETLRKTNKAMTRGAGRVARCGPYQSEIDHSLSVAFALMEQATGPKADDVRRTLRPLLERAAPALIATGRLWLTTLFIHDRPAACALQFPHPAGPQLYNCGFDPALREWSPGVVLTAHLIRQAIESGAPAFDLLRGQEAYKYRLGAVDRPLHRITLRKS